eukprot:4420126-Prymnesium_polylepis.1
MYSGACSPSCSRAASSHVALGGSCIERRSVRFLPLNLTVTTNGSAEGADGAAAAPAPVSRGHTAVRARCPCGVWYADDAREAVAVGVGGAPADSDDRLARSRALSRERKAGGAALPSCVCTAPNEDSSKSKSSSSS